MRMTSGPVYVSLLDMYQRAAACVCEMKMSIFAAAACGVSGAGAFAVRPA
jgi:hypothetical protein